MTWSGGSTATGGKREKSGGGGGGGGRHNQQVLPGQGGHRNFGVHNQIKEHRSMIQRNGSETGGSESLKGHQEPLRAQVREKKKNKKKTSSWNL